MYLPAITLGYAVPAGDFDSSVHSVFHSAANLRVSDGDGLLTLVLVSEPDLPQGIRLDTPKGFSFEKLHIGEQGICRQGILYFENSGLAIQLKEARRWKCELSRLEVDGRDPAISAAWNLAWDELNRRQKRFKAEIIAEDLLHPNEMVQAGVLSKAGMAIRRLLAATRELDLAGLSTVETLIGLGSGLTPSGDDLLAGYLAGLWCTTCRSSERIEFTTELGKRIIDRSTRTNDISRTYLFHAVHGQVSSRLAALAEAIAQGEEADRLLEIAERAMQTGSTSGMDAVTGLLIGLSAWEN